MVADRTWAGRISGERQRRIPPVPHPRRACASSGASGWTAAPR